MNETITALFQVFPPIEIIASIIGIVSVVLTIRQNILCWPTGIVMVILYIWIFFQAKLYSDAGLQVIYVFLQIYGWYNWLHGGKDNTELNVKRITVNEGCVWLVLIVISTVVLGRFTKNIGASFPFGDAFTTVVSLTAQYLMARKILESWALWITVDVVSIYIYYQKALYVTDVLYMVFLCLACMGFAGWRKALHDTPRNSDR